MNRARRHNPDPTLRAGHARGFTIIELMISMVVLAVVIVVMMTVLLATVGNKTTTMNNLESTQAARVAVDMMARDLRSAGYGADNTWTTPQPAIAYVDSQEIILSGNFDPYPDSVGVGPHDPPLAYDPGGSPKPYPLTVGWAPPRKYRTGAELVRWTLDVNNDGTVDDSDQSDPNGVEAASSRNPDDYVLVRQVYGDSTGGVAGNNGGSLEKVALVQCPGGANPPMFEIYLRGSSSPWDWSAGAIPPALLVDIERVVVQVTAASSKPNRRGQYATTTMTAQVNSLRNTPDFGDPQYTIQGYVFVDSVSTNGIKDAGEPGLRGVNVLVGTGYTATTDTAGHYQVRVPEGSYTVRHAVPAGFGIFTNPDSFVVTVPPAISSVSFADTALPGGHLDLYAFEDSDTNGVHDMGERMLSSIRMEVTPGGAMGFTDSLGYVRLFAPVGPYSAAATLPDTMTATTPNPVSGLMAFGDSAAYWFGMVAAPVDSPGTITGEVFIDDDRDGNLDAGEGGAEGVWVGVSPDSGLTVLAYTITDASGLFSLRVPPNDPPGDEPYAVYIVLPSGFFATTTTSISPVLIQTGETLSDFDFGVSGFQIIELSAQRVLCLGSGDLIEKDWSGSASHLRHGDADLVLGADAFGTDQVSVWFNDYDSTPLFNSTRDYNRTAAQAVECLSVNRLDEGDADFQGARNDVVTGTKWATAGNFFVWLNQNSSGNQGYLPLTPTRSYTTSDMGDVQAVITGDMSGGLAAADANDILVGTKSPTPGQGTMELWQSSGGPAPTYTAVERHPPYDLRYTMGEVTGIAHADIDGDGRPDLAVSTLTTDGAYTGEVLLFKFMGKTASPRFLFMSKIIMYWHTPTCVALTDVDGDGRRDLVCGSVTGVNTGDVIYYRNDDPATFTFTHVINVSARGPVQCLALGDFGGAPRTDIAVGWRENTSSYTGGISIYYTDLGTIPLTGVDPSGGYAINWCAALAVDHFNWGTYPTYSGPMLLDLAAGVKSSPTDAAILLFIR